jgi:hypothetical protein
MMRRSLVFGLKLGLDVSAHSLASIDPAAGVLDSTPRVQ